MQVSFTILVRNPCNGSKGSLSHSECVARDRLPQFENWTTDFCRKMCDCLRSGMFVQETLIIFNSVIESADERWNCWCSVGCSCCSVLLFTAGRFAAFPHREGYRMFFSSSVDPSCNFKVLQQFFAFFFACSVQLWEKQFPPVIMAFRRQMDEEHREVPFYSSLEDLERKKGRSLVFFLTCDLTGSIQIQQTQIFLPSISRH